MSRQLNLQHQIITEGSKNNSLSAVHDWRFDYEVHLYIWHWTSRCYTENKAGLCTVLCHTNRSTDIIQVRDVVSVSTFRSRDVVSKRLGLVETWEGLGLYLVSDWKSNVSVSSRYRTIGSRLQANMHSKSTEQHNITVPTSTWDIL